VQLEVRLDAGLHLLAVIGGDTGERRHEAHLDRLLRVRRASERGEDSNGQSSHFFSRA
jgi:hypothetical protein